MKNLKFLGGARMPDPLPDDCATWMWDHDGVVNPTLNFELHTDHFTGIEEFLSYFPNYYIVIVHSIVGLENGIVHTAETDGTGWGFNIREDLLEITWYQFHDNNEITE